MNAVMILIFLAMIWIDSGVIGADCRIYGTIQMRWLLNLEGIGIKQLNAVYFCGHFCSVWFDLAVLNLISKYVDSLKTQLWICDNNIA